MRLIAIALLGALSGTSQAAVAGWEPDVQFTAGRVTGLPAKGHRVHEQHIDVIQTENCAAAGHSGATLQVPESCGFLRGLYRYTFQEEGTPGEHEIIFEFDVTRHGNGHVFLLAAPIEAVN